MNKKTGMGEINCRKWKLSLVALICIFSLISVSTAFSGNEEEYDIDLDEFADEIEDWMIDELKKIGCDCRGVIEC